MQLFQIFISFCVTCTRVHSDICITGSRNSNADFLGNYVRASMPDSNGNMYYEKQQTYGEQQDCQSNNKQEYLYLNLNNEWQTNYILNDASSHLKCPSASGTPDQCTPNTWNNAGNIDPSITVTNIACPPSTPSVPTISCMGSITIESNNPSCSGIFNHIADGLYHKDGDCGPYFYYNPSRELWECGPDDKRDYCLSTRGGLNTYYLRSRSNLIETVRNGETITIDLAAPAGQTATITCGGLPVFTPMISCNFIEIKKSGNCEVDGIYASVFNRNNFYNKIDSRTNMKYFQYSTSMQSYVVADADITNECDATSSTYTHYLKSSDPSIGSLMNGQNDMPLQLEFPITTHANGATISCLTNTKPIKPAPVIVAGDLCVVIPLWLNGCPNYWKVSGLYRYIGDVNGFAAYELNADCESIRYLFYVEYFSRYVIADTLTNPPNEIYFYCTNTGSTREQCQWSNPHLVEVSDASTRIGGCDCNSQF